MEFTVRLPYIYLTFVSFCLEVSDVSALAELRNLQTLHLDGTDVREDTLQCLATHPSLSALSLAGIPVADGNHTLEIISGAAK